MDDLNRLASNVDRLHDRLDSIDKTLAVNVEHLKIHMARTELNEDRIERLEDKEIRMNAIIKSMLAIGSFVAFVAGLLVSLNKLGLF